jgi:hypothetical protein
LAVVIAIDLKESGDLHTDEETAAPGENSIYDSRDVVHGNIRVKGGLQLGGKGWAREVSSFSNCCKQEVVRVSFMNKLSRWPPQMREQSIGRDEEGELGLMARIKGGGCSPGQIGLQGGAKHVRIVSRDRDRSSS